MSFFVRTFFNQLKSRACITAVHEVQFMQGRCATSSTKYDYLIHPRPTCGRNLPLRRKVHYEEKYTVKPLNITNLAGRDPSTGRVVVGTLGGGLKHKYHWIQWTRKGPSTEHEPPIVEEVIDIIFDGNRSAKVALVAGGDEMKYYLAAHDMKPGDIIKTSSYIPNIPIQSPNIGDAYPLGALQIGTMVHNVERRPTGGSSLLHAAGTFATIIKKVGKNVHLRMPSKHEIVCDEKCMAVVGRVSNIEHSSIPIGSAQKLRELGRRPRSGLWHRKDGRFGRKIHPPKTFVMKPKEKMIPTVPLDSAKFPKFYGA